VTDDPNVDVDVAKLSQGLKVIRRRRWYLWLVILVYLPLMGMTLKITKSIGGAVPVFGLWFAALMGFGLFAAYARCPRCGNYFHVHGMTLLFLRQCLHCQLHISTDKKLKRAAAVIASVQEPQ
jgi:hypothetical protein